MKNQKPYVIAIAAVSGGGKTTITKLLGERLTNSKELYFDDYDFAGPEDIIDWVERGSNYDEWDLTPFVSEIEKLLSEPLDYLIIDFPFAYKHSQMNELIDSAIFIDTPLDIALTRRIVRDYQNSTRERILTEMEHLQYMEEKAI